MQTSRKIKFVARKPYDYLPLSEQEKKRLTKIASRAVLNTANKFDGTSTITIHISATGNA